MNKSSDKDKQLYKSCSQNNLSCNSCKKYWWKIIICSQNNLSSNIPHPVFSFWSVGPESQMQNPKSQTWIQNPKSQTWIQNPASPKNVSPKKICSPKKVGLSSINLPGLLFMNAVFLKHRNNVWHPCHNYGCWLTMINYQLTCLIVWLVLIQIQLCILQGLWVAQATVTESWP